jgi:hypothetical protein
MAGGPIGPSSDYISDTSGKLFGYVYPGGGGNAAPHDIGYGVAASLSANVTLELRFPIPPAAAIPSGTLKLLGRFLANATSGTFKYTVQDAFVASGSDPSSATLTSETQNSQAVSAADTYMDVKTTLTASPTGNGELVVAVTFDTTGWTLAVILMGRFYIIWE